MAFIAQKLISASGGVQEETDDDFNLVTSLYHFDGSNGEDNDVFTGVGASGASQSWTRNGNVGQGSFSPFSSDEGKWSVYFDGSSTHQPLSVATSNDIFAQTSDFTLEFFYFGDGRQQTLVDTRSGLNVDTAIVIYMNSSGQVGFYVAGADRIAPSSSSVVVGGTWNHIALARSSSVTNMWINGSLAGSVSDSYDYANTNNYKIGGPASSISSYHVQGYISNYRFIKGTALYSGSGSITVPTSYLTAVTNTKLLCCQSNRYKDNSTVGSALSVVSPGSYNGINPFSPFAPSSSYNASTMGGSGHFVRTTNDSLSISDSSLAIGTSDFTIEGWFYFDGNESGGVGLFQQADGLNGPALGWWPGGSNGWQFYYGSNWTHATGATARMFEWTHVAYVRSSSVSNLYVNGVKATSDVSDSTNYTSTVFEIGQFYSAGYGMEGYISNFKMCLNAIYTSAFTPPTALVTPTSGGSSAASTKILVDFTNGKMFDQSATNTAATIGGNVTLNTSVKKFGTSSCNLFGGTGARLAQPPNAVNSSILASGKFTIEFWLYVTAYHAAYSDIVGVFNGISSGWLIYQNGNNLDVYINGGTYISGSRPSTGSWKHIALTRDGTSLKMFVDGTQHGSTSTASLGADQTDYGLVFGGDATGRNGINGYIDEFRLTLGKARYTSNFTVPTEAFANR